jgi:hypothetical protein
MGTSSAPDIRRRPHRTRRGASGGRRFRRAFLAIQAPPGDALNNFLQARRYARPPQVRGLGRLRCMAAAVVAKLIAVRRRMPAAAAATSRGTKRPRHSASKSITKRYQRRNSTAHRCGRGFAAGSFAFKPRRSNSRAAADRLGIWRRNRHASSVASSFLVSMTIRRVERCSEAMTLSRPLRWGCVTFLLINALIRKRFQFRCAEFKRDHSQIQAAHFPLACSRSMRSACLAMVSQARAMSNKARFSFLD